MAARGPVPKRSDERRRENKPDVPITLAPAAFAVSAPVVDESWHPVARAWFESLTPSGQSRFYEPSDWALAYLLAESISRDLKPQFVGFAFTGHGEEQEAVYETIPMKGASLSAYLRAMSSLLVTEGDRRRASVELQREQADPDEVASVTALDRYRAEVGA